MEEKIQWFRRFLFSSFTTVKGRKPEVKADCCRSFLGYADASGCFKSLGSKKLELLTWANENTTINEIVKIDGFSETSAKNYLIGIKKFNSFISNLPVSIIKDSTKILATSDKYAGWSVVFTGVRDKDVEKILQEGGGEIGSGVSKKTTHLVIKEKGSGSSKEKKAEELGIKIFELEEFRNLI